MDEKTDFLIYCIEEYKNAQKMSGKTVIRQSYPFRADTSREVRLDTLGMILAVNT